MISIKQIRAGRALLDWSQSDLAGHAGLSQTGIARIENGTNQPNSKTLKKIMAAFDFADIEFFGTTGLRERTGEVKVLRGQEGFLQFMDDVYNEISQKGGEICVYNVDEKNWFRWMGEDNYKRHAERMREIQKPYNFKILVEEGDDFFIANEFAEYRWFPKNLFRRQSFYAYGDKLAFIHFEDDDVTVQSFGQKAFSEGFKVLFNIAWDHVAISAETGADS